LRIRKNHRAEKTGMIAIIDYGMGNLHSVQKALERVGARTLVTDNPADIAKAAKIVLPGVGAIRPAMNRLEQLGMVGPLKSAIAGQKPFLGICVGFQLLFTSGEEGGRIDTLGVFPGTVRRFTGLKVPQMGWNQLRVRQADCPLFAGIGDQAHVYFCHSYYAEGVPDEIVATRTDYGVSYPSGVWRDNLFGVQFHPEKSQTIGLQILKNFVTYQP
jgi:glutamine amidotransferase